jgi:hypothetical protein
MSKVIMIGCDVHDAKLVMKLACGVIRSPSLLFPVGQAVRRQQTSLCGLSYLC